MHVARMEDGKGAFNILGGELRERDHLEDLRVNGRIILKFNFGKWDGKE